MAESRFTGEFFVPGESEERLEADHTERYRYVVPLVAGVDVLDIACGAGYGSRMMAEGGAATVQGVDISQDALAIAEEGLMDGLEFHEGDICTFGETDSTDVVVCFETIEHVPDPWGALGNLRRVLRPGGTLYISSPNRPITSPDARLMTDTPSNEFHVHEFTPSELRAVLVAAGFTVAPEVLGQRIQPRLPRRASGVWASAMKPKVRARADLRSVRAWMAPRYFVLTATI